MNQTNKKEVNTFFVTFGGMVILIFGFLLPWLFEYSIPAWPFIAAVVSFSFLLVKFRIKKKVFDGWMRFAGVLGKINTFLVLGLLFFVVITPFGFVMRKLKKLEILPEQSESKNSYIVQSDRMKVFDFERPF
ncbi:SxtJ family membrane protein [Zooshikella sp. RANM57]|uniref:SxtJ family membrane protein n=1 Tax=Zooshikella sp. RANM57 TaxID=3425863 RepID=UPI003D7003FE